ncbi:MAG: hypothetical protein QM345_09960 [Bacillota bacterium]|nr:hypothetical protein [Bacillota bacterium]
MKDDREDLIIKYIQDDLTVEEKMDLFDLTLKDEAFRTRLKEELEFAGNLKGTNLILDQKVKDRIYQEIRIKVVKENLAQVDIGNLVTEGILSLFKPRLNLPLFKLLKK